MNDNSIGYKKLIKFAIIGSIIGFTVMALMLFIFAFAMVNSIALENNIIALSIISAGIGGFFGGAFTGLRFHKMGLISGGITGLLLFAMIFVLRLVFSTPIKFNLQSLILFTVIILFSVVGAISGMNLNFRKYKKRRID